jgi:repressor LexA
VDDLTTRQQEILELITSAVRQRGYPPSVREIGDELGLSSPSTVHSHLSTLVRLGYLRRDPTKPRAIEVVDRRAEAASTTLPSPRHRDVPLVGRIAAGSPILAEEDVEDVFALPPQLVGSGPVIMLEVRGDSMIEAGILNGDYVVVRRQDDAEDGEIVAAMVDGEATVKRLERRADRVILHAENPAYHPMEFHEGVSLVGKVVSVLRAVR